MHWSQDIVVSILFPYLLPSLPIFTRDCWPKEKFKGVLEYLLMLFCNIDPKEIQDALKMFIKQVFLISSSETSLDNDISFLADISQRSSFEILLNTGSEAHCLYGCSFLIEHKADIHENNDFILTHSSCSGYKHVVALLLKHKANIHANYDFSLRFSSCNGHKDTVALLLEHKADIHAMNNNALRNAIVNGRKDVVALLLEYKANTESYMLAATETNHPEIVVLLLQHKADIHALKNNAIKSAVKNGHRDIVGLLIEHKANVHKLGKNSIRSAIKNGHTDTVALLIENRVNLDMVDNRILQSATFNGHKDTVALVLKSRSLQSNYLWNLLLIGACSLSILWKISEAQKQK
jgi:ankyrin repeat protein